MTEPPGRSGTRESDAPADTRAPAAVPERTLPGAEREESTGGRGIRTALLALVLGVLAVLWVVQDEVIHSSIQVGNAVPPIPALAALLLLAAAARMALRRRQSSAK